MPKPDLWRVLLFDVNNKKKLISGPVKDTPEQSAFELASELRLLNWQSNS